MLPIRTAKAGALYFATRDPVSGAAYYLSLALFALFPFLVRRTETRR